MIGHDVNLLLIGWTEPTWLSPSHWSGVVWQALRLVGTKMAVTLSLVRRRLTNLVVGWDQNGCHPLIGQEKIDKPWGMVWTNFPIWIFFILNCQKLRFPMAVQYLYLSVVRFLRRHFLNCFALDDKYHCVQPEQSCRHFPMLFSLSQDSKVEIGFSKLLLCPHSAITT